MVSEVRADVAAARDRDPAAQGVSTFEILSSWAGVQALLAHRVAHALMDAGVPLLPRAIAYVTRAVTGVEIHPAAVIGSEFFIDHGSGVVIGETAVIGDRVTLYQGVTLGGTGFQRGKRHPTLGDNVTVGSGAKLLGPIDGRRRRQGRRQHRRGRGRAAGRDRGRQPRPPGPGRRQAGRRPRRRLDPPAGPDRRGDQGDSRSGSPSSSAASPSSTAATARRRGGPRCAPHRPLLGRRLRPGRFCTTGQVASLASRSLSILGGDAAERVRDARRKPRTGRGRTDRGRAPTASSGCWPGSTRPSARRSSTARGRCWSWPGPARARPGSSPTGSPTCSPPAPPGRGRSSRSPSPTRRRRRCASGSAQLVGRSVRAMWVTTFHSSCARMLRADAERLGYSRSFTIYDESDSLRMLKRCMRRARRRPEALPAAGDPARRSPAPRTS